MANPLQGWEHAKKRSEGETRPYPLQKAPVWDETAQSWTTLISKKYEEGVALPNLKGKYAHWDGTLYSITAQSILADTKVIRELQQKYPEKRVFIVVLLEEIDARLALSLGRRR